MLGPAKPRRLDQPIAVSLEELVPQDQYYRHFEAKEWHGLRRLRLRGLMNANIRGLLIAAGLNLKRWLEHCPAIQLETYGLQIFQWWV
jgi:hypothetical protein